MSISFTHELGQRSPRYKLIDFANATSDGPHAKTLRSSYSVPKGKHAHLGSTNLSVFRVTNATASSSIFVVIELVRNNESPVEIGSNFCFLADNTRDSYYFLYLNIDLYYGDTINVYTTDISTGGTCNYNHSIIIKEEDI